MKSASKAVPTRQRLLQILFCIWVLIIVGFYVTSFDSIIRFLIGAIG